MWCSPMGNKLGISFALAFLFFGALIGCAWGVAKIDDPLPGPEVRKIIHPLVGEPRWLVVLDGYKFSQDGKYIAYLTHREPEAQKNGILLFYLTDGKRCMANGSWHYIEQ